MKTRKHKKVERIAEIIGFEIGPLDCHVGWNPTFLPKWPKDYIKDERQLFRKTARVILKELKP